MEYENSVLGCIAQVPDSVKVLSNHNKIHDLFGRGAFNLGGEVEDVLPCWKTPNKKISKQVGYELAGS